MPTQSAELLSVLEKENILEKQAHEYVTLIETAHAPIFGIDREYNVSEWNGMAERITGYVKTEVMGKPFLDLIEPEYRDSVKSVLYKALNGENSSNYRQQLRTKTGETRHLLINATTRLSNDGAITGVIGVAQDLSLIHI